MISIKRLVTTQKARRSFSIIARSTRFGGGSGIVLPLRALEWPHKRGVRAPLFHSISTLRKNVKQNS